MSEKFEKNKNSEEEIENTNEKEFVSESESETEESVMTEAEFSEQYKQLPMWQQVLLVILFLFGMAAVVVVIDFVVEFGAKLLKKIF